MRKLSFILIILAAALLTIMPQPVLAAATISALNALPDLSTGTVTVTGRVNFDPGSTGRVSIQIMDSSDSEVYSGNTSISADGSFTLTCSLGDFKAANYRVKATVDNGDMPALVFFIPSETSDVSQDKTDVGAQQSIEVVVPLLPPPIVTVTTPANNAECIAGTAITISASGTGCDHMAACYKDVNGKVTWLGVQNGNSYSASFTPQLRGSYTVTVCGRNTPKSTDPGSMSTSASHTVVVELPTPTVRLISPSDTYGGSICPPGTITISAVGTGCENMEVRIMKNNQSISLGVQQGNIYQATIIENARTDILVTVYGRNTAKSTDPGYKQTQQSAYMRVRPK